VPRPAARRSSPWAWLILSLVSAGIAYQVYATRVPEQAPVVVSAQPAPVPSALPPVPSEWPPVRLLELVQGTWDGDGVTMTLDRKPKTRGKEWTAVIRKNGDAGQPLQVTCAFSPEFSHGGFGGTCDNNEEIYMRLRMGLEKKLHVECFLFEAVMKRREP